MIFRDIKHGVLSRPRLGLLSTTLLGGAAALMSSSSAFALCATTGVAPAVVTVTCTGAVVTDGTTNSVSPNANTVSSIQSFNANLVGNVQAGANVSGNGLDLLTTAVNGSISFTNNGTLTTSNGFAPARLEGNGGNVSYTGTGALTGAGGNSPGIQILNNAVGTGAVSFNSVGGSITTNGTTFGIAVNTSTTGGLSYTTSGGHTMQFNNITGQVTGINLANSATTGDTTITSGTAMTAAAGGNGPVFAFSINQQGTGNVSLTQSAAINLSGTNSTGVLGSIVHSGTSGNATWNQNGTFTGGAGAAQGLSIDFTNAASTGVGSFTLSNNSTLTTTNYAVQIGHSGAGGGAAETHQGTVTAGSSILAGTAAGNAVSITGTGQSLNLTNGGTISSILGNAIDVSAGFVTGTNTGIITGVIGVNAGLAGSNFVNAGAITGTGGTALSFTGANNTLELRSGYAFTGNVIGGAGANTLRLGGTVNASFNTAAIGVQYTNFTIFDKAGTSTWTLTGTSPVVAWTVSAGTLSGNGGTSLQGNAAVAAGATLNFNQTAGGTYAGVISGAGVVTKDGASTLTLNNANTYTGATTVNAGTLALGAAGTIATSSQVNLAAAGTALDISATAAGATVKTLAGVAGSQVALGARTLTIANSTTSFAGVIGGTGGLTLTAGSFGLTGTNLYTGNTTINGGTLSVDGSIATSTLTTVNAGGTLGGNGTLGNTTINAGGVLAPGNSIGALTVAGNLAFAAASSYMVEVSPANADRTNVTGTAALGGATVNASFAAGTYVAKQYTLINAAGGLGGSTFGSAVNTNLPGGFKSSLSYDANNAYLDLALSFTPTPDPTGGPNFGNGLTGNQQAVGNALINFFNTTGGIPLVFGALTPTGLTQVSGETATGSQQTTFNAMNQFMGVMTDPFMAGRGDPVSGGGNPNAFAEEESLAYAARGQSRTKSERDAYAAIYTKAPPLVHAFEQRWSVWAAGFGGSQRTDGNTIVGSNDTRSSIYGGAVGADYRFSPNTIAGFALAGGGTNFSVNGFGSGRSDLFQAGAFIRHTIGAAYLSGALAYGWQDITTDRTVTVAGIDRLRAQFNANAWSGRVEGGYRLVSQGFGWTPYAAGQFTTFELPAYAEQAIVGSNIFALAYNSRSVTDTRSELGLRTDKSFAMPDGIFTLRGRAAWAHDFNPDRAIGATFQALPGASFVVNGARQAADAALVTGSAEMKWISGWSTAATFEGEFSNVTRSYAGKGVVRYAW